MAKTATVTKSKTATKDANTKTKKAEDKADKPKRPPSAYNIFIKENLPKWNEAHPDRKKEGMAEMAKLWANAEENPNRGKAKKDSKAKKDAKEPKAASKSKSTASKSKSKKKDEEEEELRPARPAHRHRHRLARSLLLYHYYRLCVYCLPLYTSRCCSCYYP
ncbi:hypothetical protein MSAN_02067700 [Mycena sanguinolenta]|uniref:HMG box domain-containing protein n=1 Tax=Mycena sanguinolenta TaxID=230812 RepID=A0A8H6XI79_9AGAR|nr:hypothetical protein MSAN_02067700 [Mycena sanguinolenta]